MVGTGEFESPTSCMSSKRSNQLSYAPIITVLLIVTDLSHQDTEQNSTIQRNLNSNHADQMTQSFDESTLENIISWRTLSRGDLKTPRIQ